MFVRRALLCLALVACSASSSASDEATEAATTEPTSATPASDDKRAPAAEAKPPAPACAEKSGALGDTNITLDVGGRKREAILHAPPGYDPARPMALVLVLHPLLLDHIAMRESVRIERFSDDEKNGFLALFPNGVDKSWNAGECCGTAREEKVDDVGFIRALLEEVAKTHCVDDARIFATGFSNGAFLAHRLGCELDDKIRAIVPVAGTLGIPEGECKRKEPLPVLAFHGTQDKLVPYEGGKPTGALGLLGRALDAAGTFQAPAATNLFWTKHNGAAELTTPSFKRGEIACDKHEGTAPVTLCTVTGGGHQWPGSLKPFPAMGHSSNDIDATEAAVTFFREHGL